MIGTMNLLFFILKKIKYLLKIIGSFYKGNDHYRVDKGQLGIFHFLWCNYIVALKRKKKDWV